MSPFVQSNLALVLFLPWFAILGVLFWVYPRQPRDARRRAFDMVSLVVALVLTPLWASYLVKVYAWRTMLAPGGSLRVRQDQFNRAVGVPPPAPDVFTPPPTARVLGASWYGPQCFVDDSLGARSIAWQFHPEVTTETYSRWIDEDENMIRAAGADPDELRRQALANAKRSRNAAYQLTDDALEYLGVALESAA